MRKISNSTRILWLLNTSVLSYLEILVILSLQEKVGGVGGTSPPSRGQEGKLEKWEVMIIKCLHIMYIDILFRRVAFEQT